jgi:hypothetical protein
MKKRKAKRIKQVNDTHKDPEALEAISKFEKMKEKALLNLIVEVVVKMTLEEFYGNKEPPK